MQQTTVQNSRALRFGSGIVEVGDNESSLVNLGAMTGITFEESWDSVEVEADNAGRVSLGTANHVAGISGDLMEINLENLHNLRGGIDNFENVAGTLVSGETQTVASGNWAFNDFIKIEHQNGDGSMITVNSVTGSVDGELTVSDDYYVGQNEHGEYGIFVVDGAVATTASQSLTIDYDYTPNAAVKFSSGGRTEIKPKVVRVTNTNELGKKFQITIFKARNQEGISIEFPSDQSGEVATCSINLQGEVDATRDVGAQLFQIYDEQSVA